MSGSSHLSALPDTLGSLAREGWTAGSIQDTRPRRGAGPPRKGAPPPKGGIVPEEGGRSEGPGGNPSGVPPSGRSPARAEARPAFEEPGPARQRRSIPRSGCLSWHLNTKCDNGRNRRNRPKVKEFKEYLKTTSRLTLELHLFDTHTGKREKFLLPYMHRWTPQYRNKTLAKFYKFNEWWIAQDRPPITLLTLTTYQDSAYAEQHHGSRVSMVEAFEILKRSWDKLRVMLRKRVLCRPFDYLWSIEPHLKRDTGYPHMHVAIIGELTDNEKAEVKRLWSEVYNAGSYEHGAYFSEECLDAKKDISNAGFYLFKYLGKSFCVDPDKMTAGELAFNAVLWEKRYRQWGASQTISGAMKLDTGDVGRYIFLEASLSMEGWTGIIREAPEAVIEYIREEWNQVCSNFLEKPG